MIKIHIPNLFPKKYPDLDVNCCDFKGHGALEIAVRARDFHMMQELLSHPKLDTDLLYKAVLIAIEENLYDEVNCLLERLVRKRPRAAVAEMSTMCGQLIMQHISFTFFSYVCFFFL